MQRRVVSASGRSLLGIVLVLGVCGLGCRQSRRDDAFREHVLALLRSGALTEARAALDSPEGARLPGIDELWAKYHLERIYRAPLTGDSITAALAIAPSRAEHKQAREYIHYSIQMSARAAMGDAKLPDARVADAEEALWRGDDGRQLHVLLASLLGERCLREQEWPCVNKQVAILRHDLRADTEGDILYDQATALLREKAISAQRCPKPVVDGCIGAAIQYWAAWEELTHQVSPDLARLQSERRRLTGRHTLRPHR